MPQNICPRCQEAFSSPDQLLEHAGSEEPCQPRIREPQEGINGEQYKALRRRTKPSSKGGPSEEQRWNEVYAILFPDHRPIPSPCELFPLLAPHHDAVAEAKLNPKPECENCDSERFTKAERQDLLSDWSEHARHGLPKLMRPKVYRVLGGDDCDPARLDEIVGIAQEALEQLILSFQRPGIASGVAQVPQAPDEDAQPPLPSPALNDAHLAEIPSLGDGLQRGSSLFLDSENLNYSDTAMPHDGQWSWCAASSSHSQDVLGDYLQPSDVPFYEDQPVGLDQGAQRSGRAQTRGEEGSDKCD